MLQCIWSVSLVRHCIAAKILKSTSIKKTMQICGGWTLLLNPFINSNIVDFSGLRDTEKKHNLRNSFNGMPRYLVMTLTTVASLSRLLGFSVTDSVGKCVDTDCVFVVALVGGGTEGMVVPDFSEMVFSLPSAVKLKSCH